MAWEAALAEAAGRVAHAQRVACLTGAGVSAESGVATFRDAQTGLWSRFNPQQLASQAGFAADPDTVWQWYMARLDAADAAQPNQGHVALAQLAPLVPHFQLITQNVDDLHERAGSRDVIHLHGSIARFRCNRCGQPHMLTAAERAATTPPRCRHCGERVRPAVVWFGELLPEAALHAAWRAAETCDVMLVVGTSGVVYPAAQLPFVAKEQGATIIEINPEPGVAAVADVVLAGPSGEVAPALVRAVTALLG
ncbi:MAG: NAD-dependent deacylase [Caldilineaceae bacterium]|nr:NAD-dependent deacylase [Caldilineaceae bacterium]